MKIKWNIELLIISMTVELHIFKRKTSLFSSWVGSDFQTLELFFDSVSPLFLPSSRSFDSFCRRRRDCCWLCFHLDRNTTISAAEWWAPEPRSPIRRSPPGRGPSDRLEQYNKTLQYLQSKLRFFLVVYPCSKGQSLQAKLQLHFEPQRLASQSTGTTLYTWNIFNKYT